MTETTGKAESGRPLQGMFTAVPPRYDLINRIITWGLDRGWRRLAARECLLSSPRRVLDLCCGTGDLAVNLAPPSAGGMAVTGLDYSLPMLHIARDKVGRLAAGRAISFICGDASRLPFADGSFDVVGISFAWRNLTYQNRLVHHCLAEIRRVLVEGGRFVIVETSQPRLKVVRWLFHLYLRWLVYPAGYWLSGNRGAYRYLAESAARFYTADEVSGLLLGAGFSRVSCRSRLWGAVAIHVAVR
ncbi:MAG: ubiquinone/menaquinone biosynthesis methyltransferase [Chloroflexota bacterium]